MTHTIIPQSLWVYKYNTQDVLVILQSLWVYKYNKQDVLVILQSLWVYKYNTQGVLAILQSLWVYKYNTQGVLAILQSLWVYKYNTQGVLAILQSLCCPSHSTVTMAWFCPHWSEVAGQLQPPLRIFYHHTINFTISLCMIVLLLYILMGNNIIYLLWVYKYNRQDVLSMTKSSGHSNERNCARLYANNPVSMYTYSMS